MSGAGPGESGELQPPAGEARGRWTSLAGATAAQIGISYLEQGAAALVPYVKADYHLSSTTAGFFGTSLNVGRALAGTLAARPVDRFGERPMILAGAGISGLLAIFAALAPTAPLTLCLLLLSGVAQAGAILAGITAIAMWFRRGARGIAMGIRQAAVPIAGALAAASLPPLALHIGWRHALLVAGGLEIAIAAIGMLAYRDYPGATRRSTPTPQLREAVSSVVRDPDLSRAVLAGTVLAMGQFVTLTYIQLSLVEDVGTSLGLAAVVLAVTQVAGIAGRLVWGAISDLLFGGQRRGVLLTILALASLGAVGMALAGRGSGLYLAVPMALVLGFTTVGSPGIYLALISDLSKPRYASATMGVGITFIQGSAIFVPPVFGGLADATSSYRAPWLALAALLALTLALVRPIRGSA